MSNIRGVIIHNTNIFFIYFADFWEFYNIIIGWYISGFILLCDTVHYNAYDIYMYIYMICWIANE